jgi:hypothetical protein
MLLAFSLPGSKNRSTVHRANGGHASGNELPVPEQGVGINYRQPMTGAVGQIKGQDVPSDIEAVSRTLP